MRDNLLHTYVKKSIFIAEDYDYDEIEMHNMYETGHWVTHSVKI